MALNMIMNGWLNTVFWIFLAQSGQLCTGYLYYDMIENSSKCGEKN